MYAIIVDGKFVDVLSTKYEDGEEDLDLSEYLETNFEGNENIECKKFTIETIKEVKEFAKIYRLPEGHIEDVIMCIVNEEFIYGE